MYTIIASHCMVAQIYYQKGEQCMHNLDSQSLVPITTMAKHPLLAKDKETAVKGHHHPTEYVELHGGVPMFRGTYVPRVLCSELF